MTTAAGGRDRPKGGRGQLAARRRKKRPLPFSKQTRKGKGNGKTPGTEAGGGYIMSPLSPLLLSSKVEGGI